jgi:hypothetical protein
MDATFYCCFSDAGTLKRCLYYFDPATSLPFADEVEPEEAARIEAVEQLPTADAITQQGELAAFIDLQLDDDDWEEELAGLYLFIRRFQPTTLAVYFDTLEEYAAVWLAGKKKWQSLYTFGDDAAFDAELYALDNTQPGWHQRLLRVLAHCSISL